MQPLDLFCEECGAANPRDAVACFACQSPLTPLSGSQESNIAEAPSAAEPESADPCYLQITLSDDSTTTVRLVRRQPAPRVTLLHERYEVLKKVGTGGFGAVYKARDTQKANRLVAIKSIELDTLSASQAIEATDTFNRELNLLSSLDHPHLPTIHEHFIDATHWYLVMDFIDGEPLDEYLQQCPEPRLPLYEVIDIGLQLCDVLRYLHYLQPPVIFRDVKPANILRTPGGRIYLIDFGIARRFKHGQAKDTTPLGSPGFAAPEQYGRGQTTPRADLYGLGATLYFLLTGHDPASTPFNLPPIFSLCPTLPHPLAELITSMLALDPQERPSTIVTVQQALLNYVPITHRVATAAFQVRSIQLHTPIPRQNIALPPLPATKPAVKQPWMHVRWLGDIVKKLFVTFVALAIVGLCILLLSGLSSITARDYHSGDPGSSHFFHGNGGCRHTRARHATIP